MASLTFLSYEVEDTGIEMEFLNPTPGPGKATNYTIFVTDAELSGVSTPAQLRTLVVAKLQRKIQASGIASKLDTFIGQSVTI